MVLYDKHMCVCVHSFPPFACQTGRICATFHSQSRGGLGGPVVHVSV